MTEYAHTLESMVYRFRDLKDLLAKATPLRSGDMLAGVAATSAQERVAAQMALAELPLTVFLNDALVPYDSDEVTRLIIDTHDRAAFAASPICAWGIFATGCSAMPPTAPRWRRSRAALRPRWRRPCQN